MKKVYFDSRKCLGCHSCEFACALEHSQSKSISRAFLEEHMPARRRNVRLVDGMCLTVSCRHCDPAPCVEACMAGAMTKDADTGEVRCDADKCVGCWMCVMVCPFGAVKPGELYTLKCDMCAERDDSYACVEACPTKALFVATQEEFNKIRQDKQRKEKATLQK